VGVKKKAQRLFLSLNDPGDWKVFKPPEKKEGGVFPSSLAQRRKKANPAPRKRGRGGLASSFFSAKVQKGPISPPQEPLPFSEEM